jgi:hypothetical protein
MNAVSIVINFGWLIWHRFFTLSEDTRAPAKVEVGFFGKSPTAALHRSIQSHRSLSGRLYRWSQQRHNYIRSQNRSNISDSALALVVLFVDWRRLYPWKRVPFCPG